MTSGRGSSPLAVLHGSGTLGGIILASIRRFGDRPAIADDTKVWTYRQLGEAIGRCMAIYRQVGLRRGDGIAMAAANRVEQVAAQYAALLLGLRYTSLQLMAARDVHDFVLNDAEIVLLILEPNLASATKGDFRGSVPSLRTVLSFGPSGHGDDMIELMAQVEPDPLTDEADCDAIAYLFYTGGTTGRPKGVMLGHRSLVMTTLIQGCDWDLDGDLRFLAATPTSHASGIILPTVLMRGGYVHLMRGFDPAGFCQVVERELINCTFIVPTMLYGLLDSQAHRRFDIASLRTVIYGAAPMCSERMREALAAFGPIFVQLYGQTEVPMCISTLRKADHDPERPARLGSAGLPCPSVQVKLFDSEMNEVTDGERGEICVRSPLVMNGYWRRDAATAAASRGGWHHTGDVAIRSPEGFLRIVDRTSDLIITGGYNVYPREVEDALAGHPAVSASAVIGVPDAKWGEAVTAFVVLRAGASVAPELLQAHVREMRGAIWAPKRVLIVETLPITPLGKVDRNRLRAQLEDSK